MGREEIDELNALYESRLLTDGYLFSSPCLTSCYLLKKEREVLREAERIPLGSHGDVLPRLKIVGFLAQKS